MKTIITITLLFLIHNLTYSQVGINTQQPNNSSILDIVSTSKGLLVPRVALKSSTDTTTITNGNIESLLVYNTATSSDIIPGYYYWTGSKWQGFVEVQAKTPQYFYIPALVMPIKDDAGNFLTNQVKIDLYNEYYKKQFGLEGISTANTSGTTSSNLFIGSVAVAKNFGQARSTAGKTVNVISPSNLDYFVTYYDTDVFSNVSISDQGILTYNVKADATPTAYTFMNIIFQSKNF